MILKVKLLRPGALLPQYHSEGAAGLDLRYCPDGLPIRRDSWGCTLHPTGIAIELPEGYEAQIRPRSGGNPKVVLGTIDSDYRGELFVRIADDTRYISGDRIAQLVIAPVAQAAIWEAKELSDSARGANGFGSSGVK